MECSPPGSSVHVIVQARILEWVAMPPGMETTFPAPPALAGRFFTTSSTWEAHFCMQPSVFMLRKKQEFILMSPTLIYYHMDSSSLLPLLICTKVSMGNSFISESAVLMFLWSYRFHSFPKLLRSALLPSPLQWGGFIYL